MPIPEGISGQALRVELARTEALAADPYKQALNEAMIARETGDHAAVAALAAGELPKGWDSRFAPYLGGMRAVVTAPTDRNTASDGFDGFAAANNQPAASTVGPGYRSVMEDIPGPDHEKTRHILPGEATQVLQPPHRQVGEETQVIRRLALDEDATQVIRPAQQEPVADRLERTRFMYPVGPDAAFHVGQASLSGEVTRHLGDLRPGVGDRPRDLTTYASVLGNAFDARRQAAMAAAATAPVSPPVSPGDQTWRISDPGETTMLLPVHPGQPASASEATQVIPQGEATQVIPPPGETTRVIAAPGEPTQVIPWQASPGDATVVIRAPGTHRAN